MTMWQMQLSCQMSSLKGQDHTHANGYKLLDQAAKQGFQEDWLIN